MWYERVTKPELVGKGRWGEGEQMNAMNVIVFMQAIAILGCTADE